MSWAEDVKKNLEKLGVPFLNHWGPEWPPSHHNCKCVPLPYQRRTEAEALLDLAGRFMIPREELIEVDCRLSGPELAVLALAMALCRAPAGLRFRAIVEDWDRPRIVMALY